MAPERSEPRVSVIIPTFNRTPMLGEAIESVLGQTLPDFELLVVDDGSTDATPGFVGGYVRRDRRVRYLRKENGGTADARQHGLDHARAEHVALLDSDDYYFPRFLESQVAVLDARPEVDLTLADARFEGPWGHGDATVFSQSAWQTPDSIEAIAEHAWALPSAMAMRTGAARELGFRSRFIYSEDTDFLWRFLLSGRKLVENPEVLSVYRRHAGEGTVPQKIDNQQSLTDDHIAMFRIYSERIGDDKKFRLRLNRLIAESLMAEERWREARPYVWKWWFSRPDSTKAIRALLKSCLKRS